MTASVHPLCVAPLSIVLVCGSTQLLEDLAAKLRGEHVHVRCVTDECTLLAAVHARGPDAVWIIDSGESAVGAVAYQALAVAQCMCALPLRLFCVGSEFANAEAVSRHPLLAAGFAEIPPLSEILRLSLRPPDGRLSRLGLDLEK